DVVAVCGNRRGQNLQRDIAFQPRVAGTIDLAHSPGADRRCDLVGTPAVRAMWCSDYSRPTRAKRAGLIADLRPPLPPREARPGNGGGGGGAANPESGEESEGLAWKNPAACVPQQQCRRNSPRSAVNGQYAGRSSANDAPPASPR